MTFSRIILAEVSTPTKLTWVFSTPQQKEEPVLKNQFGKLFNFTGMAPFNTNDKVLFISNGQHDEELANIKAAISPNGTVEIVSSIGELSKVTFEADGAVLLVSAGFDAKELSNVSKHLKPGSTLVVKYDSKINEKSVFMDFTMAGFVDIAAKEGLEVTCKKPNWEIGTSTTISLPKKTAPATKAVWTISGDDVEEELEDEDDLLEADDLLKPAKRDDCEVGKNGQRKACKNCTCGRKESAPKSTAAATTQEPVKSACGNCYLGDAFRCGGCPYLGKPAFKPGERVELSLDSIDV